jgi:hypothetical protein
MSQHETLEEELERLRYRQPYHGPEIKGIYQLRGGSDSGGVYRVKLTITNILRTEDGLVIEVE